MKNIFLPILLLLMLKAGALDICLAKINIVSLENTFFPQSTPPMAEKLASAMKEEDILNTLNIHILSEEIMIQSILEAGDWAFDMGEDYLLYGTLFENKKWWELRVSLYERETDKILSVFYGKSSPERANELVRETGGKISRFIYHFRNIEKPMKILKREACWEGGGSIGYWSVLPSWHNSLTGLFSIESQASFLPEEPVYYKGKFTLYPCFSGRLGYALGLNKPSKEDFFYHSFLAALPIELLLEWNDSHRIGLGITSGIRLDWLIQNRTFGGIDSGVSQAFLLGIEINYTYKLPRSNWSIGAGQRGEIYFYDPLLISYRPMIILNYSFAKEGS